MNPEFSVVIPALNEEESLVELVKRIKEQFSKIKGNFEIIFIDDGSTDETLEIMQKLQRGNSQIRIFSFRKHLGKAVGLTFGFQKARGKYIVTMDADLQDDPVNIPKMLKEMKDGNYDLVSGWRKNRRDSILKKINSKFFNKIVIPLMFGEKFNDMNSGLKLYKSELAKEIKIYGGMHRFIPVLASEMGYSVCETPIVHHSRKYGYSKFKSTKILTDIPDLISMFFLIKYNRRPLHFFSQLGGAIFAIGCIIIIYLVIDKALGHSIGRRPLLIFGVLFVLAGIQTIFTGLLADLMVNFHRENPVDNFPIKYQS